MKLGAISIITSAFFLGFGCGGALVITGGDSGNSGSSGSGTSSGASSGGGNTSSSGGTSGGNSSGGESSSGGTSGNGTSSGSSGNSSSGSSSGGSSSGSSGSTSGSSSSGGGTDPVCGDATLEGEEVCDDGNTVGDDGCSANCSTIELGFECSAGNCNLICGNGTLNDGEACDDGARIDGDGCSADCQIVEAGFSCPNVGAACINLSTCGDGDFEPTEGELCDDGNQDSDDGCRADCGEIETGYECPSPGALCQLSCGDGNIDAGEACDVEVGADDDDGDGCQADCSIEAGFECPTQLACNPLCGNGILNIGETCDEGDPNILNAPVTVASLDCSSPNNIEVCNGSPSNYGCQSDCSYEDSSSPGTEVSYCGDDVHDFFEACDNGAANDDDAYGDTGCTSMCQRGARCGDTVVQAAHEQCDAGASSADYGTGACTVDCNNAPFCGDGTITNDEQCDDNNNVPGDGCTANNCLQESGFICHQEGLSCTPESTCGNGVLNSEVGEACDDGNQDASDGCDATCSTIEPGYLCPSPGMDCGLACTLDTQCPSEQYCDGTLCLADECEQGELFCDGNDVLACSDTGDTSTSQFTCSSETAFTSVCTSGTTEASCTCADDWDCPEFMFCEVGACVGSGEAPDCQLPPSDITTVLPSVEIHWGGEIRSDDDAYEGPRDGTCSGDGDCDTASGFFCNPSGECRIRSAFPNFSHVLGTPTVANLDDDNGDGLINEFDFPEVLYTSYRSGGINGGSVIRAIHGGGPNKGLAFWSHCDADTTWYGSNASGTAPSCPNGDAVAEATSVVTIADLDRDGTPEVIFTSEDKGFRILTNLGVPKSLRAYCPATSSFYDFNTDTSPDASCLINTNLSPATRPVFNVSEMDGAGLPELTMGRRIFQFEVDATEGLVMVAHFEGTERDGRQSSSVGAEFNPACQADLNNSGRQELIAGGSAYVLPAGPGGISRQRDCPGGDTSSFCSNTLDLLWHLPDVSSPLNDAVANAQTFGYCAVADVWGADFSNPPGPANPLDGIPEVVLIADGNAVIIDGPSGVIISNQNLGGGINGGAPNVDDFDGDGFPEIASALRDFYVIHDLQAAGTSCEAWSNVIPRRQLSHVTAGNNARDPGGSCSNDGDCNDGAICGDEGQCLCLHNNWRRGSDDASSRSTSSSVFDFNGDGLAEVVYNDECYLMIFDGLNGEMYFEETSRSRTGFENPVVADVDNDGNAEIVSVLNTESNNRCDDDPDNGSGTTVTQGPNGVIVWGDPSDRWVSARRTWNQFSYRVTNVHEDASIPQDEPNSWGVYNGRQYNTYRSQPRSIGVAPDLIITLLGVSSPDASCGTFSNTIDIAFRIENIGDLRVGPGVEVSFEGDFAGSLAPFPFTYAIAQSLEPGQSFVDAVQFDTSMHVSGNLPTQINASVDSGDGERECEELNNDSSLVVDAGSPLPDLSIAIDSVSDAGCPDPSVTWTITNEGSAAVTGASITLYAGDPSAGAEILTTIEDLAELSAGGGSYSETTTLTTFPNNRNITVFIVADPDDNVQECDESDNQSAAASGLLCSSSF